VVSTGISARTAEQQVNRFRKTRLKARAPAIKTAKLPAILNGR
jgi:hypothetical protein